MEPTHDEVMKVDVPNKPLEVKHGDSVTSLIDYKWIKYGKSYLVKEVKVYDKAIIYHIEGDSDKSLVEYDLEIIIDAIKNKYTSQIIIQRLQDLNDRIKSNYLSGISGNNKQETKKKATTAKNYVKQIKEYIKQNKNTKEFDVEIIQQKFNPLIIMLSDEKSFQRAPAYFFQEYYQHLPPLPKHISSRQSDVKVDEVIRSAVESTLYVLGIAASLAPFGFDAAASTTVGVFKDIANEEKAYVECYQKLEKLHEFLLKQIKACNSNAETLKDSKNETIKDFIQDYRSGFWLYHKSVYMKKSDDESENETIVNSLSTWVQRKKRRVETKVVSIEKLSSKIEDAKENITYAMLLLSTIRTGDSNNSTLTLIGVKNMRAKGDIELENVVTRLIDDPEKFNKLPEETIEIINEKIKNANSIKVTGLENIISGKDIKISGITTTLS